jgi:hypothetical protein
MVGSSQPSVIYPRLNFLVNTIQLQNPKTNHNYPSEGCELNLSGFAGLRLACS